MRRLVIVAAVLCIAPRGASAHSGSITHARVDVDGAAVHYALLLDPIDLVELRGVDLARYVTERISVLDRDAPCPAGPATVDQVDDGGTFTRVQWTATCAAPVTRLAIEYHLFFDLDRLHQGIVHATAGGATQDAVLTYTASRFVWDLGGARANTLDAGFEQLLEGAGSIALATALLLLGARRFRGAAILLAAFAAGTALGLSGLVVVPERVAACALAACIAYAAAENGLAPDTRGRAALAAAFGLVHGLWLARGVASPGARWATGAALGTAVIGALVLTLAVLLADQLGAARYRRYAVPALSIAAGLYALGWLAQRA